jgi:hypothetical protein
MNRLQKRAGPQSGAGIKSGHLSPVEVARSAPAHGSGVHGRYNGRRVLIQLAKPVQLVDHARRQFRLVPRKRLTQSLANFHIDRAAVRVVDVQHNESVLSFLTEPNIELVYCSVPVARRLLNEDGTISATQVCLADAAVDASSVVGPHHIGQTIWPPWVTVSEASSCPDFPWNRCRIQTTFDGRHHDSQRMDLRRFVAGTECDPCVLARVRNATAQGGQPQ